MAFMMPVVKNNYEIYPAKSRPRKGSSASTCSSSRVSRPASRTVSESDKSIMNYLSTSPPTGSAALYSCSAPSASTVMTTSAGMSARPHRTVRFSRSMSQDSSNAASRKSSTASCRSVSSTASVNSRGSDASSTTEGGSTHDVVVQASSSPKVVGTLGKFHSRLVDKLKRKLRIKDNDDDDNNENTSAIRSST